eukprot:1141776-Pelagomonas_calceolata.AAC.5
MLRRMLATLHKPGLGKSIDRICFCISPLLCMACTAAPTHTQAAEPRNSLVKSACGMEASSHLPVRPNMQSSQSAMSMAGSGAAGLSNGGPSNGSSSQGGASSNGAAFPWSLPPTPHK